LAVALRNVRKGLKTMLYPAMSPNGKRVHLADKRGRPICGSDIGAGARVCARITCPLCARRRPAAARRHQKKPLVVGLNWEPLYAALRRALEAGATEEPRVRVPFWPVLAPAEAQ
jgi:hypothetical protein